MKYLYIVYQYLLFLPLISLVTLLTALITIVFSHFKYSLWLHAIQSFWARCFCYLLFLPVKVEGGENLKKGISYVFVSNHQSAVDIFLIYGWLPVLFKWLIKRDLHEIFLIGWACDAAGHIFVDRDNRMSSIVSVRKLEHVLKDGCSTVIFPEGHRTPDGLLHPFRRGAFQMAVDMNVSIVPIAISGCYYVLRNGKKYITWHPLKIHIGNPIELTEEIKNNSNELMERIHRYIQNHIN